MGAITVQLGAAPAIAAELGGVVIRPEPHLQAKAATPTTEAQEVTADEGYDGLSMVDIAATPLEARSVTPSGVEQVVEPVAPAIGLSRVTVGAVLLQTKEVMPGTAAQQVTPDVGYVGLDTVTVAGDEDLTPGNIRAGADIFGVEGDYDPQPALQQKTVEPTAEEQEVVPDEGYDALSQVTVEAANLGAKTVTADGVYSAADDGLLGYGEVTVDTGALPAPSVGYVVTARDAQGYPTAVDHYGNVEVEQYRNNAAGGGPFRNLATVSFKNAVTLIRGNAFLYCVALMASEVVISGTTGNQSFRFCTSLGPKLKLKITNIGESNINPLVFAGCTGLQQVWISAGTNYIYANSNSNGPFQGCTNLTDIYLEASAAGANFGPYWNNISASAQATVHYGVTEAAFDAL